MPLPVFHTAVRNQPCYTTPTGSLFDLIGFNSSSLIFHGCNLPIPMLGCQVGAEHGAFAVVQLLSRKGLGLPPLQTSLAETEQTPMPVAQTFCLSVLLIPPFCLAAPVLPNPSCEYSTLKGELCGRGLGAGLPLLLKGKDCKEQEFEWRTNVTYAVCSGGQMLHTKYV